MNKILFTTSWDDGSVLDLKVAKLLSQYDIKGTFYIPQSFDGKGGKYSAYDRRLTEEEIRSIAMAHEVGGHTLSHRRLTDLSLEDIKKEVAGSREFLQGITDSPVKMFAFPGGKFNGDSVTAVREAGFVGARTTQKLITQKPADVFLMGATVICQPFPLRKIDATHYYWRRLFDPLSAYKPMQWSTSWLSLAKKLFKRAHASGDYFHLYGHSWELEQYGMWKELELFFDFVKKFDNLRYVTNGDVAKHI